MKKIVSVIKPFILQQNIFVYEDGNKIDVIKSNLDNIENNLIDIAKKYDTKEIQLIGSKNFLSGIQKRIETAEMTKFGKNELKIKIIK